MYIIKNYQYIINIRWKVKLLLSLTRISTHWTFTINFFSLPLENFLCSYMAVCCGDTSYDCTNWRIMWLSFVPYLLSPKHLDYVEFSHLLPLICASHLKKLLEIEGWVLNSYSPIAEQHPELVGGTCPSCRKAVADNRVVEKSTHFFKNGKRGTRQLLIIILCQELQGKVLTHWNWGCKYVICAL